MCFSGSGAPDYVKPKRVLPSLRTDVVERNKPTYSDVRTGAQRRSLFSMETY